MVLRDADKLKKVSLDTSCISYEKININEIIVLFATIS
jgi:hypothetical protein